MQGGKGQVAQRQKYKKKLEIGCVVWFYYIAVWGGRMYDTATVINAEKQKVESAKLALDNAQSLIGGAAQDLAKKLGFKNYRLLSRRVPLPQWVQSLQHYTNGIDVFNRRGVMDFTA